MPVEDEADLAGFFDPDEFGQVALYRQKGLGPGRDVSVILLQASSEQELIGARLVAKQFILVVRRSDVQRPEKSDTFSIGHATYTVQGSPRADVTGMVWNVDLTHG